MPEKKRYYQRLVVTLAPLLFAPQTFSAGPPVAFDSWSKSGNNVSAGCPSGFVCSETVNDAGMLQRTIIDDSGNRYFQTVIIDSNAGATLSSESFVQGGNQGDGIATKQVLNVSGTTALRSESVISSGWAATNGSGSNTKITQIMSDSSLGNVTYSDSFIFETNQDANENVTGYFLDIRQEVLDSAGNATPPSGSIIEGSLSGQASGQDKHVFVTRKVAGDFSQNSGSATLQNAGGMGGMMDGGGPTGGTVSWQVGDEVQVIWIGQICEGCQTTGMGGMGGGGGGSAFSYQSYENLSSGTSAAARSITTTAPLNWQPGTFGAEPQF